MEELNSRLWYVTRFLQFMNNISQLKKVMINATFVAQQWEQKIISVHVKKKTVIINTKDKIFQIICWRSQNS